MVRPVARGRRFARALPPFCGALLAACAGAQRPEPPAVPASDLERFVGSKAAEELGASGWMVAGEQRIDLDGGEELEALVVEGRLGQGPEPEELRLSIWKPTRAGWVLLGRSEPVAGSSVGLLQAGSCGGEAVIFFAAVEEEPDQRRHRLLVFEGLPELRRSWGVERDVEVTEEAGFVAEGEGFAFRRGGGIERWRCGAEGIEEEAAPALVPGAPPAPVLPGDPGRAR